MCSEDADMVGVWGQNKGSLVVFGFGMCEDVRLQVSRLGKLLIAAIKRTDIRPVSSVNPDVCAQVEIQ